MPASLNLNGLKVYRPAVYAAVDASSLGGRLDLLGVQLTCRRRGAVGQCGGRGAGLWCVGRSSRHAFDHRVVSGRIVMARKHGAGDLSCRGS